MNRAGSVSTIRPAQFTGACIRALGGNAGTVPDDSVTGGKDPIRRVRRCSGV